MSDAPHGSLLDHPLVVALLERLADLVATRVHGGGGGDDGAYYTTSENPFGSARAFRDAARRGSFPSFKIGRQIAAKKSDVHQWIESRTQRPGVKKAASDDDSLLAEFGVRATQKRAK